ncbi:hypothetical protein BS50DRAFT_37662 [Corynespora cassiicola Philippines]|uniref:Mid2 domain-containing protein n=1 Tax=Corynespora cassiicola Philippines TaxID=1448308 RepID=A0A2T2PCE2_CORCC|nr:hypothetical protein BS50DRAFT_37662 [Corynespora cassiicola Philippines]
MASISEIRAVLTVPNPTPYGNSIYITFVGTSDNVMTYNRPLTRSALGDDFSSIILLSETINHGVLTFDWHDATHIDWIMGGTIGAVSVSTVSSESLITAPSTTSDSQTATETIMSSFTTATSNSQVTATSTAFSVPPTSTSEPIGHAGSSSLSVGAKAGIGVGVGFGTIIIVMLGMLLYRQHRLNKAGQPAKGKSQPGKVYENQELPSGGNCEDEYLGPVR